jgi:hypothetical protein
MDGSASGSCLVVCLGMISVEPSGFVTAKFVSSVKYIQYE